MTGGKTAHEDKEAVEKMKEPRIAILSPSLGIWGGGQIYIEKLCNYMRSRQVDCCILTAEPEKFSCPTRTIPAIVDPLQRALRSAEIAGIMRRESYTHVILNDLSSAWLAPLFRLAGFKVVALLHIPLMRAKGRQSGHGALSYRIIAHSLRVGAHKVLSVNPDNMSIAPGKSVFVGNFVSSRFFGNHSCEKRFDLCFVGRFSWEKNVGLLLGMVARARTRYGRELKVLLVGEGPDEVNIRKRAEELGVSDLATLSGWVRPEDLPAVYHSARCFVVSSHHEGFATTLLESHACGLPAVTTAVGYCGKFVTGHGKETGMVFSAADLEDPTFYDRLFHLVDHHGSYRKACIAKAAEFSEERVLDKICGEVCV